MFDLVVTLARALEIAALECRRVAATFAPQSNNAAQFGMLADACEQAASVLIGASVRASRI
jgi:hypothetical protein